jgi:hypothetical protein
VLAWYKVDNIITSNLTYSLHDIADKLLIFDVKQQSHTHYRDMWLEMGQQVFHIEKDMKSWKGTTEQ